MMKTRIVALSLLLILLFSPLAYIVNAQEGEPSPNDAGTGGNNTVAGDGINDPGDGGESGEGDEGNNTTGEGDDTGDGDGDGTTDGDDEDNGATDDDEDDEDADDGVSIDPSVAEGLLAQAEDARDGVISTFNNLDSQGLSIPVAAQNNYDHGESAMEQAQRFLDDGRPTPAAQQANRAMKHFKNAMHKVYQANPDSLEFNVTLKGNQKQKTKQKMEMTGDLIEDIESVIEDLQEEGENTTELELALDEAGTYIEQAALLLEENNTEAAEEELEAAEDAISDAMDELDDDAEEDKAELMEEFQADFEERIAIMEETVNFTGQLSENDTKKVLDALERAQRKMARIQERINSGEVDEAIDELEESIDDIDEALDEMEDEETGDMLKTMNKLEAKIQKIEDRKNKKASKGEDVSEYDDILTQARGKMKDFKENMGKGNTKKAQDLLDDADEGLKFKPGKNKDKSNKGESK